MRRLMLTLSLFAALGLMLGLAACKKEPAANPDEKKEEVKKEEGKKEEAKPDEKKDEKKEEAKKEEGGGGAVGVAECDEYLTKYEKCIGSKVPEAGRVAMKSGMDQTRDAWKKAAATAEGKAALGAACKVAMDAAKKATAAFNCEW